jgi:hypothetical protein
MEFTATKQNFREFLRWNSQCREVQNFSRSDIIRWNSQQQNITFGVVSSSDIIHSADKAEISSFKDPEM